MSAIGQGNDLASVIRQMLEQTLSTIEITSAGGDSPKINKIMAYEIMSQDFSPILDAAVRDIVEGLGLGGGGPEKTPTEKSLSVQNILGFANRGMAGPESVIGMITPMIPYLIPIMIASGAAMQLFEWARGPGGPLDKRYLRDLMRETNNFMSRRLIRDTEVGNRQVIIQAQANFRNLGGAGNSNSLRQMRESGDRLSNVGIIVTDAAKGLEKIQQ